MASSEDPSAIMHVRRHIRDPERTAAEEIRVTPNGLDDLGVSFQEIADDALFRFGLQGDEIDLYVRLSVIEICRAGGRPMWGFVDNEPWREMPHFGSTPEEIAANVLAEWVAQGRPQLDWGGLWFRSDKSQ